MEGKKEVVITSEDLNRFIDQSKQRLKDIKRWPESPMLFLFDELRDHLIRQGINPSFRVKYE